MLETNEKLKLKGFIKQIEFIKKDQMDIPELKNIIAEIQKLNEGAQKQNGENTRRNQ